MNLWPSSNLGLAEDLVIQSEADAAFNLSNSDSSCCRSMVIERGGVSSGHRLRHSDQGGVPRTFNTCDPIYSFIIFLAPPPYNNNVFISIILYFYAKATILTFQPLNYHRRINPA
ncbi:hypothetical protein TNCV_329071 [Trichonephila clavipes]|nr:hypothetical protein TNCV_329071 [Trichonephila clavipes]